MRYQFNLNAAFAFAFLKANCRSALSGTAMLLTLSACSSAWIASDLDVSNGLNYRPAVIYVSDFDVQPDAIRSESIFSQFPLHALRQQSEANSLVNTMGDALVGDLEKKGFEAHRLPPGAPLPGQGWLVRGVFLQINEGNKLRRAVIGFGAGHTDLQVAVAIDKLSPNRIPSPLYQIQTEAESGKGPGAVVTLNPYVAAAKYILAGKDLKQNAKQSASKIADRIAAHVRSAS